LEPEHQASPGGRESAEAFFRRRGTPTGEQTMKRAAVVRKEARLEFPEVMNLNQLAAYLQLSPQTIYKKVERGEIPGAKIGRQWRFKRAVIDEWLERTALLSPSGLDLLMQATKEAADRAGYRPEDVDRLIEKVRAETGR